MQEKWIELQREIDGDGSTITEDFKHLSTRKWLNLAGGKSVRYHGTLVRTAIAKHSTVSDREGVERRKPSTAFFAIT